MLVGQLAEESGFSKDTIRYYEKLGLIQVDKVDRQSNNYKNYSTQTLQRLSHITELKAAGFTLTEIIQLLKDFNHTSQPCAEFPQRLSSKITQINEKIRTLENYKRTLLTINESCNGKCNSKDGLPTCIGLK